MARKAAEVTLRGEGKLTKRLLREKLRRGKGPLLNLGAGLSSKRRDPDAMRQGVR
jgi:hypothetical protein